MTLETQTRSALIDQIQHFLASFKDKAGSFRYVEEIDQMMAKQTKYIVVDYNDVVSQKEIETRFNSEPDEILYAFSRAIKNILEERFPDYAQKISDDIRVRIANYPIQRSLRQINAEVIGKMTSVSGMVVRASEVKPLAKNMVYKCPEGHLTEVQIDRGMTVFTPTKCSHDKCAQRDLRIDPETSRFIDFQIVRLQELPEDLPPGQLPHYVDVTIKQDLVDNARPGDRIILTGIVRIEQEQITGVRTHSGLYRLRIEGNNIEFLGGKGPKNSRRSEREEISPEEEKIIKSLARSPDVYDRLIGSFAPHIQGHAIIKESILLLMVGSTQRILQDGTKIRGDINVFLVGDPGCLDGSSKVILHDGSIVDLASLGDNHLESINVRMQNEYGDDIATVFHKYENQKVIEIITETGKSIVGTYNHPLLTKNGWKRLDELREGDELRAVNYIPCSIKDYVPTNFTVVTRSAYHGKIPEFVDEQLASFMGFLTGDGWCRKSGYRLGFVISQKEEELLQPLLQMGENLFGLTPKLSRRGRPGQVAMMNDGRQITRTMYVTNVEYNSKNVVEMMAFLKEDSRGRCVPSSIFQSPNSVVASYLKWLFEADGTVFNTGRARRAIQLKSTSIQLLRDVQLLLLRFGIHSRIIQHDSGNNLVIRRGPSIVKYAKHIGFASISKAERLKDLIKLALEIRRNQRHDEEHEKIAKIRHLDKPQTVYDVEIPKSHKFIANGIVSHNTAKSEMLKFCARVAPRGLYTSGRGSTAAGLTAAVVRDKSGILMLEAGAVVLGDQGLVCMTEDTEIYTGNALVPVGKIWDSINKRVYLTKSGREAKNELIQVGTYDNKFRTDIDGNAFAIMRKWHKGDVIKLTFSSGLTLKVTPEHLLRRSTHVKNKWIQAQHVMPNELLRSPVRVFKPSCTLNMTEQEAYVIGCIYGDGYVTPNGITISQSKINADIIENIRKNTNVFALYDKGDRQRTLGKYVLISRMYQLHTTDKSLLKKTGFLIKNPSIDNVLLLDDHALWAFLAGVFDTDGDFNHVHGKIVAARMYPSVSEHELAVMLYALRRLGVYAKIRKSKKGFPLIQMTGRDISRFSDGIKQFSIKAQRERMLEINHKGSLERGIEKVVSVERIPYEGYVYDLSVGRHHNYEASLVYIHNCIDEFDKMKPEDRSALHEVMEQQSASIAKGGIVATLNARTSILAAANPMYGKYDPFKNITENVALPIPLLTRFDLIFVVRDIPSKEKDRNIARHIIGMHKKSATDTRSLVDVDVFTKYLAYCKRIDPILTPEAEEKILEYYLTMRNVESEEMITVTPRQLGGLVRLATARARLLQKDQVDGEDADRAIFLIQSMLEDAGVDVNTGKVDLGVLQGRPHSEVSKLQLFMDVLKSLEGDSKTAVEEKSFVKELVKTGKFTEEEARNFIRRMLREASIYESKPGHYNRV
jgi:DNA replicative helicase MCM subunit Mcm2 (Cdc46/Mcm family)